ncbi:MAG: alanine--glyoxylate aminotransferase family protein, partial [Proteobacteria bacterium]|nr:alanine--glyoxylate aminotransferase family protein [Pseudomonadota bacterium]
MHQAAPNIYTGELIDMTATLVPDLKKIARTEGQVAMYIGNGHAVWEASLSNVLSSGDKVLFAVTGNFGHGWAEMARRLGVDAQVIDFGKRDVVDIEILKKALTDDMQGDIKAVLVVQVDTGTSAKTHIVEIRKAMNE